MTTTESPIPTKTRHAIRTATERVAPLWPLQSFVAVNPFLGFTGVPFEQACVKLAGATGALPLLEVDEYRATFEAGEIAQHHLEQNADAVWTSERLVDFVKKPQTGADGATIPTMADLLDRSLPRAHWSVFIVEEISKWCAVHFDKNQTTWISPWRELGLYKAWREAALSDRNPEAFGLKGFRRFVRALPGDAEEATECCLDLLPIPGNVDLTDFLHRQLMTIPGWAGYAQYLAREDLFQNKDNPVLRELLAIRLAYDAAIFSAFDRAIALKEAAEAWVSHWDESAIAALSKWQLAYECGYQEKLGKWLLAAQPPAAASTPCFQAVFCIDVRSGIFRRHLESVAKDCQTIGFAGFFGFPVAYRNAASGATSARCPVLLTPVTTAMASLTETESRDRLVSNQVSGAWKAFQNSAASCFTFVEAAGIFFGPNLGLKGSSSCGCEHEPSLVFEGEQAASLDLQVDLALGALKNMGLTHFARLVLICGHGSQSANNPYASALDCGACGGHAGDINARLAASTLNHPEVRRHLEARGVKLPDDTLFLAGIHNTMTDEVSLFDEESFPASHQKDFSNLRQSLDQAQRLSNAERAGLLGMAQVSQEKMPASFMNRCADISQVRPEWGLANNAALIAAPRWRTAALSLDGRVFLHDYDAGSDVDSSILTLILCAPVVVASWINLQYYASRVNPQEYGSGNKTLHNVTGGLGIVEGNTGDLRTGLPLQSINDGTRFVHEARRLSVFVEAPLEKIDVVLAAQAGVCDLFRNTWLHLFAMEGSAIFRWSSSGWIPFQDLGAEQ